MSGSLYVLSSDPLLRQIHTALKPPEIARAFADDLAAALASLQALISLHQNVLDLESISGLILNSSKCVIIPISSLVTPAIRQLITDFLKKHIPRWASFQIVDSGEYLGFDVGPSAASYLWKKPTAQFLERSRKLAISGIPPAHATSQANQRATPTLTYVSQIYPPPDALLETHRLASQANLHLLNHVFPPACCINFPTTQAPNNPRVSELSPLPPAPGLLSRRPPTSGNSGSINLTIRETTTAA